MKNRSLIKRVIGYIIIFTSLMIILLITNFHNTRNTMVKNTIDTERAKILIITNNIENRLNNLNKSLKQLMNAIDDFYALNNSDESIRYYASNRIVSKLNQAIFFNQDLDSILILNKQNRIYLSSESNKLTYYDKQAIRQFSLNVIDDNFLEDNLWKIMDVGNNRYFIRILENNDQVLIALTSLEKITNDFKIINTYQKNIYTISDNTGSLIFTSSKADMRRINIKNSNKKDKITVSIPFNNNKFFLLPAIQPRRKKMALMDITFYSKNIAKQVKFHVIIPNDVQEIFTRNNIHYKRDTKTLFLLHGFSGNSQDWILGSNINELSAKYNLAIILPTGDNSFYVDSPGTGRTYGKFIGEELVEYTRKLLGLSSKREDTFIGGFSMGGFGAIRNGLQYNKIFSKILSFSSALIINDIKNIPIGFKDFIADYDYYNSVFGNLNKLEDSNNNPEFIIKRLLRNKSIIPEIKMVCGDKDFLLGKNRNFYDFLRKYNIDVIYNEYKGDHTWEFCGKHLVEMIEWVIK